MLRKTARPFKGQAPEGVFQTVDVGTGPSNAWISEQAHKSPGRRYAAVDPAFKSYVQTKLALERFGVLAEPTTLSQFLEKMLANNWKTRHFNFRMPDPKNKWGSYDFRNFFSVAKKVMFRGGKIFFTTESPAFIDFVSRLAKEEGFTPGRSAEITRPEEIRTLDERSFKRLGHKIFRFAITNGRPWAKNKNPGN